MIKNKNIYKFPIQLFNAKQRGYVILIIKKNDMVGDTGFEPVTSTMST